MFSSGHVALLESTNSFLVPFFIYMYILSHFHCLILYFLQLTFLQLCYIQLLPFAREFLQLLLRTNLMFFYFEGDHFWKSTINYMFILIIILGVLCFFFSAGLYYHVSKRAAGIRYVFVGKPMNQRPRYFSVTWLMMYMPRVSLFGPREVFFKHWSS